MRGDKALRTIEPSKNIVPVQVCGLIRETGLIRRIRPLAEIGHKSVLLRVQVDVSHQLDKVRLRQYRYPPEGMLKQTARAPVGFVNGLGVGIEKVGERD